ncbi:MAG: hypothetical protein NTV24_03830, partial [Candidatus Woesebacteria bacterium]|nr:hypothetical protein [Candidatus Woesebacteria bacterium]
FPHPDFKGFMVFDAPRILGSLYVNFVLIWKKMFNIIVIVGIIPWSVIIGKSILLLINKLLTRRKNASYIIFIVFVFIFSLLPTTIVLEGYVKYHAEILQYMFMIYLIWGMVILVAYFIYFYQIKRNVSNQFSSSVSIFIVCLGFISMTLTVFNFFAWEEYLIPFIPIVILWLANYFMDSKMNKLLVVVILSSMIIFTLSNVKTDYDQNGIRWEAAEAIINRGLVKPNEVGIINWAWVPYFYYEDSFAKRLKEVGGDKKLITQIHTWWNDDAYNYKVEKLSFVGGNCSDIVLEKNERELEQIEAKSVFATYRYCVVYKM